MHPDGRGRQLNVLLAGAAADGVGSDRAWVMRPACSQGTRSEETQNSLVDRNVAGWPGTSRA
jgi:hypothetical protein